METTCRGLGDDGRLEPVAVEDAIAGWKRGEGPFWFDVADPDPEVRARLLSRLGVDDETIRTLAERGHASRVFTIGKGQFFEYPVGVAGEPPELRSVGFVALDRAVVTSRPHGETPADWAGVPTGTPAVVEDRSAAGIVCTLLITSSVQLRDESSRLRFRTLGLARKLDGDREDVSPEDILSLRREITDLDAVCDERVAVLQRLGATIGVFSRGKNLHDAFNLALMNTESTGRRTDRLDSRVDDVQARLDSAQQEKMNRRLSRLTVISAIFLPLTLIAGIYGMNFSNMPELRIPWAYPVTLGGMLVIALGMYGWFRSRGWMD